MRADADGGCGPDGNRGQVWVARVEATAESPWMEVAGSWLSPEERGRRDRFRFEDDRRSFQLAHGLVRWALTRSEPSIPPDRWRFEVRGNGRPEIAAAMNLGALRFNLSHTRQAVACIVTRELDCGVDLELMGRIENPMRLAERTFAPPEVAFLRSLEGPARELGFYQLWTLKEACVKALGTGLSAPLDSLVFRIGAEGPALLETACALDASAARWRFVLERPDDQHVMAIAIYGPGAEDWGVTIRRVEALDPRGDQGP